MGKAVQLANNTILMIIVATSVVILSITYRGRLGKNITSFYNEGSYKGLWFALKVIFRYLLFSLCMIAYFWNVTPSPNTQHVTNETPGGTNHDEEEEEEEEEDKDIASSINNKSLIFRYTESCFNHFLQVGFTAFWPRRTVSHSVLKYASTLSVLILPIIQISLTYCRVTKRGEWTFFTVMKCLRKLVQLSLFICGVYLGQQYFRRPPIYPKDVKFGQMPWKKYRNLDASSGQQTMAKSGRSSKWILFGLLFSCILEAFLMEYQHLNRREGARIPEADRANYFLIFYKFITGSWTSCIFPLFVYPEVMVLFFTMSFWKYGRNILKGLVTYCLLISGHVTVVTILSLVIVWEIERFDQDLKYNLIETFEKNDNPKDCAKRRLYIFDQIKIKRDELIPSLSILFHYLVIDRLLFIIFDFWNFTCDKKIDFNVYAFFARHLFQLILTGWVVLKMALFNVKWPHKLIDTVYRWRLQSWINSVDTGTNQKFIKLKSNLGDFKEMEDNNSPSLVTEEMERNERIKSNVDCGSGVDYNYYNSARYFLDREYELWAQYLSQERFVKRFGFRIFGYRVDIRWFTLSFGFQIAFIGIGMTKAYFGSASQSIC